MSQNCHYEKIIQALFELFYDPISNCVFGKRNSSTTEQVTHRAQHDKDKHLFMSNSACEYLSPRHAASGTKIFPSGLGFNR